MKRLRTIFKAELIRAVLYGLAFLLAELAIAGTAAAQTTQAAGVRPPRGTWYQPVDSFDKWKARGISDLIGVETNSGAVTVRQYLDLAQAKGLRVWVQHPLLLADPTLLKHAALAGAINSPDEPDGGGATEPPVMQGNYAAIKALAAAQGVPGLPVLINFDGNKVPWRPAGDYVEYCKAADVVFMDLYPLNFGHGSDSIADITTLLRKLAVLSDGKPLGAFIEIGDQLLREQTWTQQDDGTGVWLSTKMRGPTPGETRLEVQAAVDGGASFIAYFPDVIGKGWVGFDGTSDAMAAALIDVNAHLLVTTSVGDVLGSAGSSAATQPTGPPATTQPTTKPATQPASVTPTPIAVGWTMARDVKHGRIVVTLPPTKKGRPVRQVFITDPATIAAMDAAAGK